MVNGKYLRKKLDVEKPLAAATAKTQKAEYHKIEHGAKILELVNPQKSTMLRRIAKDYSK